MKNEWSDTGMVPVDLAKQSTLQPARQLAARDPRVL